MVRHGRTEHNTALRLTGWGDPELDELGCEQAETVAAKLLEEFPGIGAIYASPLKRAQQTAAPIAERTGLQPRLHEGLKELYFGEVEGMTIPEVRAAHPNLFVNWRSQEEPHFSWPGGETRMVFHTRVDRAMWDIIVAEAGQHEAVAIVAHGGSLAGFISELQTGQPYAWRQFLLENCQYYVVEVHYEAVPVTRDSCTLRVTYTGELLPLPPAG